MSKPSMKARPRHALLPAMSLLLWSGCALKDETGAQTSELTEMAGTPDGSSSQDGAPASETGTLMNDVTATAGTTPAPAPPPESPTEPLPAHVVAQETFETRTTAGDWVVDLGIGAEASQRSIRPPELSAPGSVSFEFACPVEHSLLTFAHFGDEPGGGQQLRLYVDDQLYDHYGTTHGDLGTVWNHVAVVLDRGPHTYRFEASTETAGPLPFRLDSLRCRDHRPEESRGDPLTLDLGYQPDAIRGNWQINSNAAHGATGPYPLSAEPPILQAGDKASLEFDCAGEDHSLLSFHLAAATDLEDYALNLYVDGELYRTFDGPSGDATGSWTQQLLVLDHGSHSYRFEALGAADGRPPFHLDTFACLSEPAQMTQNGIFNLDGAAAPPELGGTWQLNNTQVHGKKSAGLSARPPILPAGGQAALTLDCSVKPHNTLRFWYMGDRPEPGQTLDLTVDGEARGSYGTTFVADKAEWYNIVVSVEPGPHVYAFSVATESAGRPPYFLDSIRCD